MTSSRQPELSLPVFDSHAHLDMARGGEAEAIAWIERAFAVGVEGILAIAGATRPGEYSATLGLAEKYPEIHVAAGIHPHAADSATPAALDTLRRTLDASPIVALGEIGLDYHYNFSNPESQRKAFIAQLKMSRECGLPVVIHTREAEEDTLSILRDEGAAEHGGVIHCFSGGETLAAGALALGFHISFSGIVTFPTATDIQNVAATLPSDRILVETDAPFLSPVPFRGRPNEPMRVVHTLLKIAALRNADAVALGRLTVENTRRCFRIPTP